MIYQILTLRINYHTAGLTVHFDMYDLAVLYCRTDTGQIHVIIKKFCKFFQNISSFIKLRSSVGNFNPPPGDIRQYSTKIVPQMRRLFFRKNVQNERR